LCLAALRDGLYHPDCPNAEYHKLSTFTVEAVIEDVLEFISEGEGEVIGGGNSANCLAARSERFGHVLVVKAYLERTESWLFENEVKIYEHLKELQGLHIPLVLGTTYSIASGVIRPMIIMSYGGVSLDRCAVNDELIDSIADALRALGTKDVYHEDFSLQNMLAQNNRAVVIDFESAQIRSDDPAIFEQYAKSIDFLCEWTKKSGDLRDFIL
jgi:predicted Ser/Thr protein kinase